MGRYSKVTHKRLQAAAKGREAQKTKRQCQNEDLEVTKKLKYAPGTCDKLNATTPVVQTVQAIVRSMTPPSNSVRLQGSPIEITLSNEGRSSEECTFTNKLNEDHGESQGAPTKQEIKVILVPAARPEMSSKAIQVTAIAKRKQVYPTPATNANLSTGRRIVSIASMNSTILDISRHSSMCGKGPVQFSKETKRGLCSKCIYQCGCGKSFQIMSDTEDNSLPINDAIVWGNTQSAIGFTSSSSLFTTLEIPPSRFQLYKKHQDSVHLKFIDAMNENMRMWAAKEKELALAKGDYVIINNTKYAKITVVLDGGWSKRSYQHSFSANCGIAVIIGARTGKVIFTATKTTTCMICDSKNRKKCNNHTCWKNWDDAPNGMEKAIILEGFQRSIEDYGLVYWKFIGDGDSSVFKSVINVYPEIEVEKIECCNHVCRNFTTRLLDISKNKIRGKDSLNISVEERRVFNPTIRRFRAALKQAIFHHHAIGSDWNDLYDDILNIPNHIFGCHEKCKDYFCKGAKEGERNLVPIFSKMNLWRAIEQALDRPASLAPSLVQKESSNLAESFMAVCCKFLEGKRKNFGQGYLYRLRMCGAVFSFNESPFWVGKVLTTIQDYNSTNELWDKKTSDAVKSKTKQRQYQVKRPLKVKEMASSNLDYGDNPDKPDLPLLILGRKIESKKLSLQVDCIKAKEIEEKTLGQADSVDWHTERRDRLTASKAGCVYKLLNKTDNTNTLNSIFGRKIFSTAKTAMEYGRNHEAEAIATYERVKGFTSGFVKKAGLVVYQSNGVLAASPDGYVGPDGLVEVKCPHSLHLKDKNRQGPSIWPEVSKSSSISVNKDGTLALKKSHDHYYQIIMQIYVTGRIWCDYFIWSEHGHFIQRIHRNEETDKLWTKMEEKLVKFWENDLAPELVDSRMERGWSQYRCPTYREPEREKKIANKQKRLICLSKNVN